MGTDDEMKELRDGLDRLEKIVSQDKDLEDDEREQILDQVRVARENLDAGNPDGAVAAAALAGVGLSMLKGLVDEEDSSRPSEHGIWKDIRRVLVDELGLKHLLYSDDDEGFVTVQFGMSDDQGRRLVMRVIYTPAARCVQVYAGYPFDIDRRMLPIVRAYICRQNYEARYTRIEVDDRDGEVYVNLVMRASDQNKAPDDFALLLHLTMATGFDEFDTLQRYSRGDFTDEERTAFLEEVERISPLMLEG